MAQPVDSLVTAFAQEFPTITHAAIVRQVQDAQESVALFGITADERDALVARLVRSHLEALTALRSQN